MNSKRYMPSCVHCRIICSSQAMETPSQHISRCIKESRYRHTMFHWALLDCVSQTLWVFLFVFYKLQHLATLLWTSLTAIFPTASVHFVLLCHFLVIVRIFQNFHYYSISYGDQWPLILLTVIALGCHKPHSCGWWI